MNSSRTTIDQTVFSKALSKKICLGRRV